MERTKLKGIVILILLILNVTLLGIVLVQHSRTVQYQEQGREQAVAYLERNGIRVDSARIPWESRLTPETGEDTGIQWETQAGRTPETLLVDFVREVRETDRMPGVITGITEQWMETKEEERGVRTPIWVIETDTGIFELNCATGTLILLNIKNFPEIQGFPDFNVNCR